MFNIFDSLNNDDNADNGNSKKKKKKKKKKRKKFQCDTIKIKEKKGIKMEKY